MSDIFNNSIWPNGLQDATEGYPVFYPLGTNKVEIPDGVTTMWPDGDKLIGDFVYKNGKVVGFIDTKALIASSSGNTTMNYSYIDINLPSIYEGELTVNAPNATVKKITWAVSTGSDESFDFVIIDFNTTDAETINTVRTAKRVVDNKLYDADDNLIGTWDTSKIEVAGIYDAGARIADGLFCNFDATSYKFNGVVLSEFDSDLSSLRDGHLMFMYCSDLTSFNSDLPNLTDGYSMFMYCSNLESFTSALPNLTDSSYMFRNCSNLKSFTSALPSLKIGNDMFYDCTNLESFSSDLSTLEDAFDMFSGCSNLTSFSSNLSSLTWGNKMFYWCTNLKSFSSDLSSLTNGEKMFDNCSNLTSFTSALPSLKDGSGMFGGCKLDAPSVKNIIDTININLGILTLGMGCDDTETDKDLFAQEVGYNNMTSLLAALQDKSWVVTAQYNGRPQLPTV